MKRPTTLLSWVLSLCVVLVVAEYAALTWLAPFYVMRVVERATGWRLSVDGARLSFPLTTTLLGVRLVSNTRESAFTVQRAVIRPRWLSWPTRTLWVDAIEIERPLWRLTRTKAGAVVWPTLPEPPSGGLARLFGGSGAGASRPWRIHIGSIKILEGVLEFIDEKPTKPFHGLVDHVSLVLGPVTMPANHSSDQAAFSTGMSFAARGKLVGAGGSAAPIYCSGWLDLVAGDLQASCRMEPLALAAFEPYFYGPPELRVYTSTVASTSQWWARAHELTSRLQLELNNFSEGDLSIRGRTILDIKKITGGKPRLSGEVAFTGPLTRPREWRGEFRPGDDPMQQLVRRLQEHNVQVIKLSWFGGQTRVSLAPLGEEPMPDIEAASREVQEALELLAFPVQEQVPAPQPPQVQPEFVAQPAPLPVVPAAAPSEAQPIGASPAGPDAGTALPKTSLPAQSVQPPPSPASETPPPAAR